MTLKEDLESAVREIFKTQWTRREGQSVPESEDIQLGNHGVDLEAAVLYADLASSTNLVDTEKATFSAECYKAFLHCSSKIIRDAGGNIRSFDGDRVMGVFIGSMKNSDAVKCALKINWAVKNIIRPAIKSQYSGVEYIMEHKVGINSSKLMAARTGIRGHNDLVWVGSAANHAAKLCAANDSGYSTFITKRVYEVLAPASKLSSGVDMWEARTWNNLSVYRSNHWWPVV